MELELTVIKKHKQIADKYSAKIAMLECTPILKKIDERKKYL